MTRWQRLRAWFRSPKKAAPAPVDPWSPGGPLKPGSTGAMVSGALGFSPPIPRGSRELHVSQKREPWVHAVTSKIADNFAAVPWVVGATRDARGNPSPDRARYYGTCRSQILAGYSVSRGGAYGDILRSSKLRRKAMLDLQRETNFGQLTEHPLITLLERPNPLTTGVQFRRLLSIFDSLTGEGFAIKERNAFGMPVELWPTPNFWCLLVPYMGYDKFYFNYGTFIRELPPRDVLWIKQLDCENPYARGSGTGFALGDTIEAYAYALKTEKAHFYNNGVPGGLFVLEGVSPEVQAEFEQNWADKHRGFWNAARMAIVNFKASFQNITPNFTDQKLLELMKEKRDTIIQVYGVPPEMMGITESSNRAVAMIAKSIFAEQVLTPKLEDLRAILQHWLVPDFDPSLVIDYVNPVPDDWSFDLSVYTAAKSTVKIDEWRDLADLEPLENNAGQILYVPPTNSPDGEKGGNGAPDGLPGGKDFQDPPWVSEIASVRAEVADVREGLARVKRLPA